MSDKKAIVYVDEDGRFLSVEGVTEGYEIKVKKEKKEKKCKKWNKKKGKAEKKKKKEHTAEASCANCKTRTLLLTSCNLCTEPTYCSTVCRANDSTHAIICASARFAKPTPAVLAQPKQSSGYGSRFVAWSAEFGGKPKYNAIMYPAYREWYRNWPEYSILDDSEKAQVAGIALPKIKDDVSVDAVTMKLDDLRVEHAAMRRRTGFEIMPNPVESEFIWIKKPE
jgi:hypothetical protein